LRGFVGGTGGKGNTGGGLQIAGRRFSTGLWLNLLDAIGEGRRVRGWGQFGTQHREEEPVLALRVRLLFR